MQATKTIKSPKYIILLYGITIRMLHSTFECYIQHSNVAIFEGSFECRTFVYALVYTRCSAAAWCGFNSRELNFYI